jgi:hypothetical protein
MGPRRIGRTVLPVLLLVTACQESTLPTGPVEPAGTVSAGGGGVRAQPPTPSQGATSRSSEPGVAHAGLAADGTTVLVHVGGRLVVDLPEHWTAPAARAREVSVTAPMQPLQRGRAHGFPVPGPASATFTAVRVGWAVVTAESDYACLHDVPACALPQQLFTMTVQVLPRPGEPAGPLPIPASS